MDYAAVMLKKEKILPRSGILLRKTKQSTFKGSRRYYRGKLLKLLVEHHTLPLDGVGVLVKDDYKTSDTEWLEGLLHELETEGFIKKNKETIELGK